MFKRYEIKHKDGTYRATKVGFSGDDAIERYLRESFTNEYMRGSLVAIEITWPMRTDEFGKTRPVLVSEIPERHF